MSVTIQNMYRMMRSTSSTTCQEITAINDDGSVNSSFATIPLKGTVGSLVPVMPFFDTRSYTTSYGQHYTKNCAGTSAPSSYPVTGNPYFNENQPFSLYFYDPGDDAYKEVYLIIDDRDSNMPAYYRESSAHSWTLLGDDKALMKRPSTTGWSYGADRRASIKDLRYSGSGLNDWACPLVSLYFCQYPDTEQYQYKGYMPASPFCTNLSFNNSGGNDVIQLYPSVSAIRRDEQGRWHSRLALGIYRWTCGLWNGMPYAGPNSIYDYTKTVRSHPGTSAEGDYIILDDAWAPFGSWDILLDVSDGDMIRNKYWAYGSFSPTKQTNVVIG